MLLNIVDYIVPYTNRNPAHAIVAIDAPRHYCNGNEFNIDLQLSVHNLEETFAVRVSSGLDALYNLTHSDAEYHADKAALILANRLVNDVPLNRPFTVGVLLQVQMRASVEHVVLQSRVTPANILTSQGVVTTGNPQFDVLLTRRKQHADLGMTNDMQRDYVLAVAGALQSCGLPDTLLGELAISSQVRFINAAPWRYFERAPFTDNDTALLRWHAVSPLGRQIYRPDISAPFSLLSSKPLTFQPISEETEVLWDDWLITTPGHDLTSPIGSLRCVLALSGHVLHFVPTLRYLYPSANVLPTAHPVLAFQGRAGPRHPAYVPSIGTAIREPMWDYSPTLTPFPQTNVVNDEYTYIRPGPLHGLMSTPRHSTYPPNAMYTQQQLTALRGNNAGRRPVSLNLAAIHDYPATTFLNTNELRYGGMYPVSYDLPFYTVGGVETEEMRATIPWFSRQASANPLYMRAWRSFSGFNITARQLHSRVGPVTGPNGNAPLAPYGQGANAGMAIDPSAILLFTVPHGDPIPAADYLTHFNLRGAQFLQRWKTWYFDPILEYVPIAITDQRLLLEAGDNVDIHDVVTAHNAHLLTDVDANYDRIRQSQPAMPAKLAIRPPGLPSGYVASVSIAPPEQSGPSIRRDMLHFLSGHSANSVPAAAADLQNALANARVAGTTPTGHRPGMRLNIANPKNKIPGFW
jgi:hypothetical protein